MFEDELHIISHQEIQVRSTLGFHLILVRMVIVMKISAGERETLIAFRWECKLVHQLWKLFEGLS